MRSNLVKEGTGEVMMERRSRMGTVYNRPEQTGYRRELRKLQSRAEKMLWRRLRNRQLRDCKFRRQHGIDQYIVDFLLPGIDVGDRN